MQRMIARLSFLCAMLAPPMAHAWDVEPGVPGAQLTGHLPNSISLKRVDVRLTSGSVTLTYQGTNNGTRSGPLILTTFIPAFDWQGVAADHPDLHMPELSLTVNGLAAKDHPRVQAMFNGKDVTADLKHANLDPLLVAKGEDALVDAPPALARRFFSNAEPAFPLWQLLYRHVWTIPGIQPGKTTIEIAYQIRPAKTEIATSSKLFEGAVLSHCGDIQAVKSMLKNAHGNLPNAVVIETITIPLQIANVASVDAYLTAGGSDSSAGLPIAAVLTCGAEEAAVAGKPSIDGAKTADGTKLSILRILTQS